MTDKLPNKIISRGRFDISYCDFGKKEDPVIVLCHGLASSGRQFSDDARFFASHGYRVILPDLRGHGRSSVPDDITELDFSIPEMAADLIAILDDAEVSEVHWVGNSLGGILALSLLPQHSQRFKTFTTFGTSYALMAPGRAAQALPALYDFIGPEWVDHLLAQSTSTRREAQEMVKEILQDYDINVVTHTAQNVAQYNFIDHALGYKKPILMIRGGEDRLVNAALMTTMKAMKGQPNFNCIDIEKGGHCANLDATTETRIALLGMFAMHETGR